MTNFQEIIKSEKLALVAFLEPIQQASENLIPVLEKVNQEMGEKVKIVKIDVSENKNLAAEMMLESVPTLMIFKNGQQVWKESGVLEAPALIRIIEKQLE